LGTYYKKTKSGRRHCIAKNSGWWWYSSGNRRWLCPYVTTLQLSEVAASEQKKKGSLYRASTAPFW